MVAHKERIGAAGFADPAVNMQGHCAVSQKGWASLLTANGQPFAPTQSLRNHAIKWCDISGIKEKKPHGIRMAIVELLAEAESA